MDNFLFYDPPAWFEGFLIFYALAFLAKSEGGIAAGPVTLLLCPLPLVVIASLSSDGDKWTSDVLTLVAAVLTSFVVYVIRVIENSAIQTRRNVRAQALNDLLLSRPQNAATRLQPYSVYLRPFDLGDHLPTQSPGGGDFDPKEHVDLETLLAAAMKPLAPMVALGPVDVASGAGRISSPDDEWKNRVATLVAHAYCVLVIPSLGGTLWELSFLKEKGYLSKCLWIMPETITAGGWQFGSELPYQAFHYYEQKGYNLVGSWAKVQQAAMDLGIFLPAYDPAGMAFLVDDEGEVAASVPLSLSRTLLKARRVRQACTKLLGMVADSPDLKVERIATAGRWDIGRRAALVAGVCVTIVGLYGVFRYGTLLGADICTALGTAVLYGGTRRIALQREPKGRRSSRHALTTGRVNADKRIGDKVRVWREHNSLRIEVSPPRNPGNILFAESKERIEVDGRALKVYNDWENIERTYDLGLVRNLRIVEKPVLQNRVFATIAFDYEGRRETFATNLTPRESEMLLHELTRFLKVIGSPAKVCR